MPQNMKEIYLPIGQIALIIAGVLWIQNSIHDVETKLSEDMNGVKLTVAVMEGNRFTSGDAIEIWEAINELKEAVPDEHPPKWFMEEFNKVKNSIERIEERISRLEGG